ncbi:YegP family protein [Thermophilibacter immobilis]|jgi:uncharacterized protein YegP (UPF0339 family)|uniref:YegP family protein n=1 Tax=Thermophilibacter immobilis TaxID=2779519 RepID=A0A7S7M7I9_9ACTN|nr:YegP family protein [Thermophilibacter immobilis]QOY60200.1 YegP family protein [Thermophilibacter immobilis]
MGQYVVVENEGRYCFNLCASNGHILVSSIIFPSKEECERGIECVRASAPDAEIEDATVDAFDREKSPKFRIYEDFDGHFFFRFITEDAGDIARSHTYEQKESLFRRIERMRAEADSSLAADEN